MLYLIIILQIISLMLLGGAAASFMQLVIYRVPRGISTITPGSFCEECKAPIRLPYLLPILGYILSKGKCRKCGCSIPKKYLLIELVSGIIFTGLFWIIMLITII